MFITVFTTVRQYIQSQGSWNQYTPQFRLEHESQHYVPIYAWTFKPVSFLQVRLKDFLHFYSLSHVLLSPSFHFIFLFLSVLFNDAVNFLLLMTVSIRGDKYKLQRFSLSSFSVRLLHRPPLGPKIPPIIHLSLTVSFKHQTLDHVTNGSRN